MFRSLAFKWTTTLVLTSLIGVILAGVVSFRAAINEYDRLRTDQYEAQFFTKLTDFYKINQSWTGFEEWLPKELIDTIKSGDFHALRQFAIADANGVVIIGGGPFVIGEPVPTEFLANGKPVMLDNQQIGTVYLSQPPPELQPREKAYVDSTSRALLFGALGAGITALIIGYLLSRQFLSPLGELTQAITAMHAGDLDQRVNIRTRDELGILAETFNEMSANLHRANQLRKQMTADIAHDLRTPLTVISGYLEGLRDGTLKPTAERFHVMSEEVALLQRLVNDLRTLSLADSDELKLMKATFSPDELLERVSAAFEGAAKAAGVKLDVQISDDAPTMVIDGERMVQVLGNLVTNALHHTPSGGNINLLANRVAQGAQLQVRDTGSGIAPDDLPKIFDRFYRSDPSRHAEGSESGLGLAIAKSIIEAHGGSISASSTLGKGTTLTIIIPTEKDKTA